MQERHPINIIEVFMLKSEKVVVPVDGTTNSIMHGLIAMPRRREGCLWSATSLPPEHPLSLQPDMNDFA